MDHHCPDRVQHHHLAALVLTPLLASLVQVLDPQHDLPAALLRVLVAGLAGGLIGLERERSQAEEQEDTFAGARTFPLIAILGASVAVITGTVGIAVVAGFLAIAALVVVSYVLTGRGGSHGTTTEIAALTTYWIGVMAGSGALLLAVAVSVGTGILLASKRRLDAFGRTLSRQELSATLTLAVLAAVILPVLPDGQFGPWGVWNPRHLWIVVVLICGVSFVAFVAMRVWGASRGLYTSGILGGIASSTAATVSLATRSREAPAHAQSFAVAAGLASLVMVFRVALLAGITKPPVLWALLPVLGVMAVAGGITLFVLARRAPSAGDAPQVTNPFSLRSALTFGVVYAVVLFVVEAAQRYLGSWGVFAAAVLSGLSDVDAITLALAESGEMEVADAATAIALAALSNTAAKLAYALWLGDKGFRRPITLTLGVALLAGSATTLVMHWSA